MRQTLLHVPALTMQSLWMIGASLAFAAMGVCIKLAAEREAPLGQIVFYRCFVSLVLIYIYLRVRPEAPATARPSMK